MIETSLDFSGLNDIAKDLEALSRAENNKVLRDATRAGAEVLKEEVIARAPVRTGKLKKRGGDPKKPPPRGNFFRRPYSWR
jgi:HK97 gp10 family phage protein